jgi:hypothetical protein
MTLNAEGRIRRQFCGIEDCPLKRFFKEATPEMPIDDIKKVARNCGLHDANEYYGDSIGEENRSKAEGIVYTADCTTELPEGTNYTNCGSVLVSNPGINLEDDMRKKLSVLSIQAMWNLDNLG